jgi:integrase
MWWMWYRDRSGKRQFESTGTEDWAEAHQRLRQRLQARDENTLSVLRKGEHLKFTEWVQFFLENYSKPPMKAAKTHSANERAATLLIDMFGDRKLVDITPDDIEFYLRQRLTAHARVHTLGGVVKGRMLKPSTVHQEFRILRRILNVAVKKRRLIANPCSGVEFPVRVDGLFRPHYVSWSEQQRIEQAAPEYLRNVIRIITETGLRIYKELLPALKEQVDLSNRLFWIPDSKTPSGRAEIPLTDLAAEAFRDQMELAGPSPWVFPSDESRSGHLVTVKKTWRATLKRAGVPYFRIYDLRSTYSTRLSAGGVADEWVTQMLRQSDSKVFKKYSQMKLQMKREALAKLDRFANEKDAGSVTEGARKPDSVTVSVTVLPKTDDGPPAPKNKRCRIKKSA